MAMHGFPMEIFKRYNDINTNYFSIEIEMQI